MNKTNQYDVLIIGAGLIGCSIAYHLTKAGFKTALLEQEQVGAGASGANCGMVQTNDVEMKHSIPMVMKGYARFDTLEEELGMPLGFRHIASLRLIAREEQFRATSEERTRVLPAAGIPYEFIPPERIPELEPLVDPAGLYGATYSSFQGQINPFRLMWAYLRRAKQNGLALHSHTRVTGFDLQGGRIRSVQTTRGSFSADRVVLATAAWTRRLGALLGHEWNIHTFRASAMVSETRRPVRLNNIVTTADHIELPVTSEEDAELTVLALAQTPDGHFLIAQADRPGEVLDGAISHVAPKAMAIMAARYFPLLRGARLLRCWSAPTTYTDDGCPLLGTVKDLDGLILAASFRSAIVNSPVAGEIVTQLVSQGDCDLLDITPFSPDRIMSQADAFYKVKSSSSD